MADIAKFIGSLVGTAASPEAGIVSAAESIIGMFKLDPTKKAEMVQQLQLANLDLEKTRLAGQISELEGQLDSNKAEAASTNWFVAGWRPFIGWICGTAFAWVFVIEPFLAFTLAALHIQRQLPSLSLGDMMPVLLGMLGLGGLRTVEKIQDAAGNH